MRLVVQRQVVEERALVRRRFVVDDECARIPCILYIRLQQRGALAAPRSDRWILSLDKKGARRALHTDDEAWPARHETFPNNAKRASDFGRNLLRIIPFVLSSVMTCPFLARRISFSIAQRNERSRPILDDTKKEHESAPTSGTHKEHPLTSAQ